MVFRVFRVYTVYRVYKVYKVCRVYMVWRVCTVYRVYKVQKVCRICRMCSVCRVCKVSTIYRVYKVFWVCRHFSVLSSIYCIYLCIYWIYVTQSVQRVYYRLIGASLHVSTLNINLHLLRRAKRAAGAQFSYIYKFPKPLLAPLRINEQGEASQLIKNK